MNTREKILPAEMLVERAVEARASGRRIILAVGRFDLISTETIEALQSARNAGALVVAAVAPDSTGRDLLAAEARAQLAAALASVDYVVIGAAAAIRGALRPDQSLELSADLAPKLIERFRLERRD
jgi:bifunctional ADP-heptose synthase (sugar kinase/adenylyltransferase)